MTRVEIKDIPDSLYAEVIIELEPAGSGFTIMRMLKSEADKLTPQTLTGLKKRNSPKRVFAIQE